jgi:muramoyltetrapeptide carboxypeptidase
VLDAVAGVVIGEFNKTDEKELERIMADYFAKRPYPVLNHFPIGHGIYNATVPHGALVELDADRVQLRIMENPVRLSRLEPKQRP